MIHATQPPSTDRPAVLVIMGSVRAGRQCPAIATWVTAIGRDCTALAYDLIDLRDWPLPPDDEPAIPARGIYAHPHTIAWSQKVAAAAAFVIVTPQYNWGYPAPLKNALDHLYNEWAGKPVMIVTYGGHGGGKCADQLRQVVGAMHMRPLPTMPALTLPRQLIETGEQVEPGTAFQPHLESIRQAFNELATDLQAVPPG